MEYDVIPEIILSFAITDEVIVGCVVYLGGRKIKTWRDNFSNCYQLRPVRE